MDNVRALITGISGFVGGHLSEYLIKQGLKVWGTKFPSEPIDEELCREIVVRELDIRNKERLVEIIKECNPRYIFHLAAQSSVALSWKNPQLTIDVNVIGTLNLIQAVNETNNSIKIIIVGSSEEYGTVTTDMIPISEECPLHPTNPYAVSKVAQEDLVRQFVKAHGMNIVLVRAFNHIGPRQAPTFVVSDFARNIALMEKRYVSPALFVGNLEAKRDFTDVRDIVKGYFLIAKYGKCGEVYNIGSGRCYKIQDLLNILISQTTIKIDIRLDESRVRPIEVPIIVCDNTKLRQLTNWKVEYCIEQTIKDVLDYWRHKVQQNSKLM